MQIAIYVLYECVLHSKVKTLSQQIHLCRSTLFFLCILMRLDLVCVCVFLRWFVCLFICSILFRCYFLNIELERKKQRETDVGFMQKKSNTKIVFFFSSFSRFFGMNFFCWCQKFDVAAGVVVFVLFDGIYKIEIEAQKHTLGISGTVCKCVYFYRIVINWKGNFGFGRLLFCLFVKNFAERITIKSLCNRKKNKQNKYTPNWKLSNGTYWWNFVASHSFTHTLSD